MTALINLNSNCCICLAHLLSSFTCVTALHEKPDAVSWMSHTDMMCLLGCSLGILGPTCKFIALIIREHPRLISSYMHLKIIHLARNFLRLLLNELLHWEVPDVSSNLGKQCWKRGWVTAEPLSQLYTSANLHEKRNPVLILIRLWYVGIIEVDCRAIRD